MAHFCESYSHGVKVPPSSWHSVEVVGPTTEKAMNTSPWNTRAPSTPFRKLTEQSPLSPAVKEQQHTCRLSYNTAVGLLLLPSRMVLEMKATCCPCWLRAAISRVTGGIRSGASPVTTNVPEEPVEG